MWLLKRCLLLIALLIPSGFSLAEEKPFFHSGVARDAATYEKYLKSNWSTAGHDQQGWLKTAQEALKAGNPRVASAAFAAAVVLDKNDTVAWLGLSRSFLAMKAKKHREKFSFAQNASSAAFLAFRRAKTNEIKAEALAVLGEALIKRSYWRPAINAYKASLALHDDAEIRKAYNDLRAQHGFRVLDYKVDSEASAPRACVHFSEPLARGRVDFSKYIALDGKDPAEVTKENRQLCILGLVHGRRYEVTVRAGLPSSVEEKIAKTAQLTIYVRDRKPSVRFTGRNYVLPRTGQKGMPLVSVNTDKVKIEVYRIGDRNLTRAVIGGNFQRQISKHDSDRINNDIGTRVWSGEMPVKRVLNENVTTAFPIDEALPKLAAGLYVMHAWPGGRDEERWKARATQWFVVSDLGLTSFSGKDGFHAFVRSLANAEPLKDVEVRLLARNNEVLASARSDENGHVKFDAGLARGTDGLAPALLVAERSGQDYAFLDLTRSSFDLTDRGVGGRAFPGPLDAHIFSERGVYRPGEKVFLTALLRNTSGTAVSNVPLTLKIHRPDGVEHQRVAWPDQGLGGRTKTLELLTTAMTGTWRATVFADPKGQPIGETSFLVADYTPQRLELKLNTSDTAIDPESMASINVEGRYLYGAPASNLALHGDIIVRPSDSLPDFKGYKFGLTDEKIESKRYLLKALNRTDGEGKALIEAKLSELPQSSRPLKATIAVRMHELSGRAVEQTVSLPIRSKTPLIGLKPLFSGNTVGEGETASFDLVAVDGHGKQVALKGLKWELLEIRQRFQWYSRNGAWDYEPVAHTRRIGDGEVETSTDKPARISVPVKWGRYRLEVTSNDPNGPAGSLTFTAGWYASENTDTPDVLDISLDKPHYKAGDTAKITLRPRIAGKAMIAVIGDKLLDLKTVDVPATGKTVDLGVKENWSPGAYITAMFYRPMDQKAHRLPSRSIGIKWLKLDQSAKTLHVKMEAPKTVRPNDTLSVPVKLEGLKPGEDTRITVAAVDVGILNLTKYTAPAPDKWFYGQRRLNTEIWDIYGQLIDGMQAVKGRVRSGGGGPPGGATLAGHPPTHIPIALYSGIVEVGQDGTAQVDFDIPAFDGTLRLMAVAWNSNQLGHGVKDVIIRDPVVVVGTVPHFLTSGDSSELHLSLNNVEGPEGSYKLTVKTEGPIEGGDNTEVQKIALKVKERRELVVPLKAGQFGDAKIQVSLEGPQDFSLERSYLLPIQPASPGVTRRFVQNLPANGGKLTIGKDLLNDLIPETVKVTLNVGHDAALDVPGVLLALDRYPYGCAEQTTSRALPLLYLSSLAEEAGLAGDKGAKDRIAKAINRLTNLQNSGGSFGLWSPIGGDIWLTAYVADFLTRAKEKGHDVSKRTLDLALSRLKNAVNYAPDFKKGGHDLAYALYVLARNGKAEIGDLRYYSDAKLKNFSTPLAQAQLGAALAMYGDKIRAEQAFGAAMAGLEKQATNDSMRLDYGSILRDGAAALTLVSETKIQAGFRARLPELLSRVRATQTFTSTQENAWLLLAAHALQEETKTLSLEIDGKEHSGALRKTLSVEGLTSNDITVRNKADKPVTASIMVSGAAASPEPAIAKGFDIERTVYTLDGKKTKLDRVTQNERFVIVLKVSETEAKRGRLILVDRLPAGFVVENPKLVNSAELTSFSWLKRSNRVEHTAFRDDKFVAAFNLDTRPNTRTKESLTVAYVIRAVIPGQYRYPAATIEDMYRPDRFSRTASSMTEIVAAK